jgi:hypothetical protein
MSETLQNSDGEATSTEVTLPSVIEGKKLKKVFKDRKEMERAAKDAGLTAIDLSKFVGAGAVGELIQKCNLLHVGLSMYAFSKSKLEEAMSECEAKLKTEDNTETFVNLGALQKALVTAYNETATNIIKSASNSKGGVNPQKPPRSLRPGTVFGAVIMNNPPQEQKAIDV